MKVLDDINKALKDKDEECSVLVEAFKTIKDMHEVIKVLDSSVGTLGNRFALIAAICLAKADTDLTEIFNRYQLGIINKESIIDDIEQSVEGDCAIGSDCDCEICDKCVDDDGDEDEDDDCFDDEDEDSDCSDIAEQSNAVPSLVLGCEI